MVDPRLVLAAILMAIAAFIIARLVWRVLTASRRRIQRRLDEDRWS